METMAGKVKVSRPKFDYISPKTDDEQALLERIERGRSWLKRWLEKRIGRFSDGN